MTLIYSSAPLPGAFAAVAAHCLVTTARIVVWAWVVRLERPSGCGAPDQPFSWLVRLAARLTACMLSPQQPSFIGAVHLYRNHQPPQSHTEFAVFRSSSGDPQHSALHYGAHPYFGLVRCGVGNHPLMYVCWKLEAPIYSTLCVNNTSVGWALWYCKGPCTWV